MPLLLLYKSQMSAEELSGNKQIIKGCGKAFAASDVKIDCCTLFFLNYLLFDTLFFYSSKTSGGGGGGAQPPCPSPCYEPALKEKEMNEH